MTRRYAVAREAGLGRDKILYSYLKRWVLLQHYHL